MECEKNNVRSITNTDGDHRPASRRPSILAFIHDAVPPPPHTDHLHKSDLQVLFDQLTKTAQESLDEIRQLMAPVEAMRADIRSIERAYDDSQDAERFVSAMRVQLNHLWYLRDSDLKRSDRGHVANLESRSNLEDRGMKGLREVGEQLEFNGRMLSWLVSSVEQMIEAIEGERDVGTGPASENWRFGL
jgi:hypothetical protein